MVRATTDIEHRAVEAGNGTATPSHETHELDIDVAELWRTAAGRLLVSALAVVFLLLFALGFVWRSEALRLIGVFGVSLLGVGAAPCQLADRLSFGERCGIAVTVGLSVPVLVGTMMVLAPLWDPVVCAAIIALAAAGAHVVGARRSMIALRRAHLRAIPQLPSLRDRTRAAQISSGLTVVGTALWLFGALRLGPNSLGPGGFLPDISYAWYAGLVMLVAAIALARDGSETQIAVPVLMLIAAVTLTPSIVYGEPNSQSAIKHVALVQQILQFPRLHPDQSIYYTYSGFFSAIAWLCRIARVANPIGLATYWSPLIALLGAIELRFLFGRVIRSGHRCWIGVMIATLADSVGQNYFSPQSEAFVIALGAFALVIAGRRSLPIARGMTLALFVLAALALAATHELTPYIAGGVLIVLAVFRLVKPRWAPVAMLVPAGAWAALHQHVLAGFVNFNTLGDLTNFKPVPTLASPGLVRQPIVGLSTDALVLGMLMLVALAVIGFVRNRGRGSGWGFIIAAGVGLVFIAVNPYGNEGVFRATLFAIPWLTLIGLAAVRKPRWRWPALTVVTTAFVACYLVSSFGLDAGDVVRASDVRVLDAYIHDAPPGSYHLEIAASGDLPTSLNPDVHNLIWNALWDGTNLQQVELHATLKPTPADLATLTAAYIAYAAKFGHTPPANLFAVYSPAAAQSSVQYGVESIANSHEWLQLFVASPQWKVVYASDGSFLFRYRPVTAARHRNAKSGLA
ncbi:MAG: hypothetical protein ABR946_05190 [Solirubrobacteraceae bacterium]